MPKKAQANESLSDTLKTEGTSPNVIMDGSEEKLLGNFKRKLREVGSHLRQTEPIAHGRMQPKGRQKSGQPGR